MKYLGWRLLRDSGLIRCVKFAGGRGRIRPAFAALVANTAHLASPRKNRLDLFTICIAVA